MTSSVEKRRKSVVEQLLKKGFSPPGVPGEFGSVVNAAASSLGLPGSTLRSFIKNRPSLIDWTKYKPGEQKALKEVPEIKQRDVEEQLKEIRKRLGISQRNELETHRTLEAVLGLKDSLPKQPTWIVNPSLKKSSAGVPTTIWSDWQYGEVVRKEEVGGINEFDCEIAKRRIKVLTERTIEFCFTHMATPEYPGIVVMLGGDMISGGIHPELLDTDDRTPSESVTDLFGLIRTAFLELVKHFGRIYVPCVVGNHGRTTIKIRHKGRLRYNYEFLLYQFLRESFSGDDRIQFFIPREIDAYFKILNHRYRLTHGDSLGTRGGDGIIGIYGKVRRGEVKIRNAEAPLGRDHDTLVMGHYHQYFAIPDLIVNPTIVGFSEYAKSELRAKAEPPAQALWFTNPQYGVIFPNRIFVDEVKFVPPASWVSWAV